MGASVWRIRRHWPCGCCETIRAGIWSEWNGDKESIQVNLLTRIPILIVYGTAAVNEENQIRFFGDIYGYDAALEKALAPGYAEAW